MTYSFLTPDNYNQYEDLINNSTDKGKNRRFNEFWIREMKKSLMIDNLVLAQKAQGSRGAKEDLSRRKEVYVDIGLYGT